MKFVTRLFLKKCIVSLLFIYLLFIYLFTYLFIYLFLRMEAMEGYKICHFLRTSLIHDPKFM